MPVDADDLVRLVVGFAYPADPVRAILTIGKIDNPHCADALSNLTDGQFDVQGIHVQRARGNVFPGRHFRFAGGSPQAALEHLQDGKNLRQFVVLRLDGLDAPMT
jgi:hypothetical protein